jgi:molybdopterin molybdotransferase
MLKKGQLYASNMLQICAWLTRLGLPYMTELVDDRRAAIKNAIEDHLPHVDIFLTSGGVWGSERDLILEVVRGLNWRGIYHRVRMGPGKAVALGLLENRPFFCLPGGPPSNEMAFLQLAIPALQKMKAEHRLSFPVTTAFLAETVKGKKDWTDFIHARLEICSDQRTVHPSRLESSLRSMAEKEALIIIPEDREELKAGEAVAIQIVRSTAASPLQNTFSSH